MKAIVYHRYGSPDVLELQDVTTPAPGDDEILVKVHAASINSWDWDLLRGRPFPNRIGGLFEPKYEILGCDLAGRVEAVGKNTHDFRVGDEVFGDLSGSGWGAFAEFVCANSDALALKPASMTFAEAAAIPQAGVLALQGLRHRGAIGSGQQVLINGAGGGVGTIALQIAKHLGAEVTCVDSAEKLAMLHSIGADHVIDYEREDFTENGLHYDLILDVVGRRSVFTLERALARNGVYVMVGGSMARAFQLLLLGPCIRLLLGKKMGILLHRPNRKDLEFMGELWESGVVSPVVERTCELGEVPEALRALGEGRVRGKIVVEVCRATADGCSDGAR